MANVTLAKRTKPQLANMDAAAMMASMSRPADASEPAGEGTPEVTESVPAVKPAAQPPSQVVPIKSVAAVKEVPAGPKPKTAATPAARTASPYQDKDRKEVWMWPDQRDDLDALQHMLNRMRGPNGYRITANSLIRIAVDLLLERKEDLVGVTEEDLRAAVGLPAREPAVGE